MSSEQDDNKPKNTPEVYWKDNPEVYYREARELIIRAASIIKTAMSLTTKPVVEVLEERCKAMERIILDTAAELDDKCPDGGAYVDGHCSLPEKAKQLIQSYDELIKLTSETRKERDTIGGRLTMALDQTESFKMVIRRTAYTLMVDARDIEQYISGALSLPSHALFVKERYEEVISRLKKELDDANRRAADYYQRIEASGSKDIDIQQLKDRLELAEHRFQAILRELPVGNLQTHSNRATIAERVAELVKKYAYVSNTNDENEKTIEALRQEVEVLRRFGNKDCTAQADEELKRLKAAST